MFFFKNSNGSELNYTISEIVTHVKLKPAHFQTTEELFFFFDSCSTVTQSLEMFSGHF